MRDGARRKSTRQQYAAREMTSRRLLLLLSAAAGAAVLAVFLHRPRRPDGGAEGDTLIADPGLYDRLTGWLLAGFYSRVADDVAAAAPAGARVLDVGCGPGHLAGRLADRGLAVTGIDLDPTMVELARRRVGGRAEVAMANVAALPFEDGSFDLAVSTLSMHHWADPRAGLAEIARVLRPGGSALVFDFAGIRVPLHGHAEGPDAAIRGSALEVADDTQWRWPGPISLLRRVEARPPG
jgi:SAM-dependent methyltransferase